MTTLYGQTWRFCCDLATNATEDLMDEKDVTQTLMMLALEQLTDDQLYAFKQRVTSWLASEGGEVLIIDEEYAKYIARLADIGEQPVTRSKKPTPEQLNDPQWWRDNAPERATHYITDKRAIFPWLNSNTASYFNTDNGNDKWCCYDSIEGFNHHLASTIPRPTAPPNSELPVVGMCYTHHNGRVYRVTAITNADSLDPVKYPVSVVYKNESLGTVWSREASDWWRSFKPVPTERERFVEMVREFSGIHETNAIAIGGSLYDAGFRAPEEKS